MRLETVGIILALQQFLQPASTTALFVGQRLLAPHSPGAGVLLHERGVLNVKVGNETRWNGSRRGVQHVADLRQPDGPRPRRAALQFVRLTDSRRAPPLSAQILSAKSELTSSTQMAQAAVASVLQTCIPAACKRRDRSARRVGLVFRIEIQYSQGCRDLPHRAHT